MEKTEKKKRLSASDFFYYYKWHIVVALVVLIVVGVIVFQVATRENHDVYVFYAGEKAFLSDENEKLQDALASVMREDYDGKDGKNVLVSSHFAMTTAQWNAYKAQMHTAGSVVSLTNDGYKRYTNEIATGYSSLFIISRELYNETSSTGRRFVKISELIDIESLPEGVVLTEDGCGVVLASTDFAGYSDASSIIKTLSPDTVLCIKAPNVTSAFDSKAKTRYEYAVRMLEDILAFVVFEEA